ncbi:MAG: 2,3-bisphosphoglycerate-independent phosphoglycerate mutase [Oscillospiraceae bacterium]|jgi:2,3-bisphosphoglycerate-independent phosphoglycerate mutase|nr:2,3-bisphosphoglycerate-independent phosphoglycerate mutase [Oscillospiraceae bacterium]
MKYILIIADGAADKPIAKLSDKTPLEYLDLPGFDTIAGGTTGLARTVPIGAEPGSDTAILTIFGHSLTNYTGRAALEAAGAGVALRRDQAAFRVNLCTVKPAERFEDCVMLSHNGTGIEGEDALALAETLSHIANPPIRIKVHPSPTFRHIGVLDADDMPQDPRVKEPHNILGERIGDYLPTDERLKQWMSKAYAALSANPVNTRRGASAANCAWPWAYGRGMELASFPEKYRRSGTVITAVPLLKGIARLSGLTAPNIEGATGDINTNYEAKLEAALSALAGGGFAAIHIEAPDECSHAKDTEGKLEAIRRIDARIILPLLARMPKLDADFRVLLLPDHPTLLANGMHDGAPVPFAIYDSRKKGEPRKFGEASAANGVSVEDGTRLMDMLFETE